MDIDKLRNMYPGYRLDKIYSSCHSLSVTKTGKSIHYIPLPVVSGLQSWSITSSKHLPYFIEKINEIIDEEREDLNCKIDRILN